MRNFIARLLALSRGAKPTTVPVELVRAQKTAAAAEAENRLMRQLLQGRAA